MIVKGGEKATRPRRSRVPGETANGVDMSDSEDFLADDLETEDHGADDTYNLGNEEEELLLAGGDISAGVATRDVVGEEAPAPKRQEKPVDEEIAATPASDDKVPVDLNASGAGDQRYRADRKERFPTERSNAAPGTNQTTIPESLDTIVTNTPVDKFNARKQFNNRGRRQGNHKPQLGNDRQLNLHPNKFSPNKHNEGPRNMDRNRPPRNRPFDDREMRQTDNSRMIPGGRVESFGPDMGPPDGRGFPRGYPPDDIRRTVGNAPMDLGGVRPNNMRISVDFRQNMNGPMRQYAPQRYGSGPDVRNPNQMDGNYRPMNEGRNIPGFQNPNDGRVFIGADNLYGAPNFNSQNRPLIPGNAPPLFNRGGAQMPIRPPFIERTNAGPPLNPPNYPGPFPVNGLGIPDRLKNMPGEGKKVHINPHFKGPVPVAQVLGNFERVPDNLGGAFTPENKLGVSNGPVSEEELEKMAKQFIDGNRRCLERAKAIAEDEDFYEKTQRFIENTTVEVRNVADENIIDPKKEYLKRKQEEFINENRLNLRKRRISPPRIQHRSPPPSHRQRLSPYTRNRPRSSHSPPHSRREPSGEPEDKDYRAKMREQAEMRARVLQAKERRRRRDAEKLTEKINQSSSINQDSPDVTISTPQPSKRLNEVIPLDNVKKPISEHASIDTPATNVTSHEKIVDIKRPEVNKENELMTKQETLEDMLEDDLLRLSPEDEDLLLSDEDDLSLTLTTSNIKLKNLSSNSSSKPPLSNHSKSQLKDGKPTKITTHVSKQSNSTKRSSSENTDDLRKKLSKPSETSQPSSGKSPQRRKIVFSSDKSKESQKVSTVEDKVDKSTEERTNNNKWRSTFSEQKLDLTAPVAARAISAVMRNSSETSGRKVIAPKNSKTNVKPAKDHEKPTIKSSNGKAEDKSSWNGRQVVMGLTGRRVVIPPKPHKPLVVVENDDDDDVQDNSYQAPKDDKKTTAAVTGLPPGMTEARLLSLCGPEVERVTVGAGGSADVSFNSAAACQRFVRRFHGRIVAACRLTVTSSH